jgi:hypothetical protein
MDLDPAAGSHPLRRHLPAVRSRHLVAGGVLRQLRVTQVDGSLLRLVRDHEAGAGSASGTFLGPSSFRWLRAQRAKAGAVPAFVHDEERADQSRTGLDPRQVFDDAGAEFAIGVRVPDCQPRLRYAADGSGQFTLWLLDPPGDSWARVDYEPGRRSTRWSSTDRGGSGRRSPRPTAGG